LSGGFLRHQPIFTGDRDLIHHKLLDRGFTPRRVALVLYGAAGIGASLSLLSVASNRMAGTVIVLFWRPPGLAFQQPGLHRVQHGARMLFAVKLSRSAGWAVAAAQLRAGAFRRQVP